MPARRLPLFLLLGLAAAPLTAAAAPPALDPFLARLDGSWDLVGRLGGKPVHYHGVGRRVLHEGWLRLDLADVARPPTYEASVYLGYDAKAGDYVAHWLDRFGGGGARVVR